MSTLFVNNLNTASGSTITVPTGKHIVGTDAQTFRAPGMILQTVNNGFRTYTQTDSTSLTSTGLTATITPIASSSKVLINVRVNGMYMTGAGAHIQLNLYRASTDIGTLTTTAGYKTAGDEASYGIYTNTYEIMDSPSTTSATAYTLYCKVSAGTGYINNYNVGNTSSLTSITVQEIAQ